MRFTGSLRVFHGDSGCDSGGLGRCQGDFKSISGAPGISEGCKEVLISFRGFSIFPKAFETVSGVLGALQRRFKDFQGKLGV